MTHPPPPPVPAASRLRRWWDSVAAWASPRALWRAAHREGKGKTSVATGVALGVFIANTPLWGLHSVMCVLGSRMLRVHPLTALAGSLVGIPPVGPVLIAIAIWIGHVLLRGHQPDWEEVHRHSHTWKEWLALLEEYGLDWFVGSMIVGTVMAAAAFGLTLLLLRGVHSDPPDSAPGDA